MDFQQIKKPRTGVTDGAGWCHRMARAVFNAPLVYGLDSATKAANATQYRHYTRAMPNVAVPVWFDHWGTYGGVYGNWGHVVVWVPGVGFLTSPWYLSYGQEWYSTVEEIERIFGAKFRFWSEDINTLRVAEPVNSTLKPTGQEEDEDMPDSMFAVVDGVPSWCWLNWSTGELFACHTQAEADWIGRYMGSVRNNWSGNPAGSDLYKNKLAFFGMLAPKTVITGGGALSDEDLKRLREQVQAGVRGALAGLTLKAVADA